MEKAPNEQRDRKYETLFDGDEIDGKVYGLGEGVTKLDAATAGYLVRSGRLAEIDDARFDHLAKLKSEKDEAARAADTAPDDNEGENDGETDFAKLAQEDYDAGRIPDDLIDPTKPATDTDRLVGKTKLVELATAANATFKPADSKADIAVAIMAARAEAESAA